MLSFLNGLRYIPDFLDSMLSGKRYPTLPSPTFRPSPPRFTQQTGVCLDFCGPSKLTSFSTNLNKGFELKSTVRQVKAVNL